MNKKIKASIGTKLQAKSWATEAAIRMLMNNLDPEIAEHPENLVVYGGIGKAARNWTCYNNIIHCLKNLRDDQTLIIQSGKPVGIFTTHIYAPRVLIANSNIVPHWANWDKFAELDKKGLIMFGQMTAGSWIYIGSQGIVQGTYETFVEMGKQHFNNDLKGKWILTAGLGGMGGAQPLAGVLAGACVLAVECDESRVDFRIKTNYVNYKSKNLTEAVNIIKQACSNKEAISVGLVGNIAEIMPEMIRRGIIPDAVTDQTSAHDPLNGYLPIGWDLKKALYERKNNPKKVVQAAKESMAVHVNAMLHFHKMGIPTFDYGNNIRQMAYDTGKCNESFSFAGFVPKYIRPLFCKGIGPFRWVALSGNPEDIYKTDAKIMELFPHKKSIHQWLKMARKYISFQGLPARICWLGAGERAIAGRAFNDMVRNGELSAPIVIGRDHLDSGSVASPNRETESMLDGSDAISDWPILNALLNTASGATWVSLHHGGGVGMGYSQHSGVVIVADGSKEADLKLQLVLTNDPATGVMRHADAGYDIAKQCAKDKGIILPSIE